MALSFDNKIVDGFYNSLRVARNCVVISHMHPDGDAVGSALAVLSWLTDLQFTTNIQMVLPHPPPSDSLYLPGASSVINAHDNYELCLDVINKADLVFGVDFNQITRVTPLDGALSQSKAIKLLVDHHHNPQQDFFNYIISVPDLSSTCELLYWLFVQMSGDSSISLNTARCLFHGINTDTGCFSYSCEDSSLYEAVAALMKHPLHPAEVHSAVTNNYSVAKIRILGHILTNNLKIFEHDSFAYMYISENELKSLGGHPEDLEGLVNYTLLMKNVRVGAFVKQTEGRTRISFRSRCDFDVNVFAKKFFGGGGHAKASGATSQYSFDETVDRLECNMLNELRNLS